MKKKNKNLSKTCVNIELMDYIKKYYLNGSVTQQEIADEFKMSLGAIKNFMYRHQINKKKCYSNRLKEIRTLYNDGFKVKRIAEMYGTTQQNIYNILEKSDD